MIGAGLGGLVLAKTILTEGAGNIEARFRFPSPDAWTLDPEP